MANTPKNEIITEKGMAWELVAELRNQLAFGNLVNRKYDGYFAKSGHKIGDTLQTVLPAIFRAEDGGPIQNFQDFKEESITIKVSQAHVALQFSVNDLLLSMDNFKQRVIRPAANALAQKIDKAGLEMAASLVSNVVGDGTSTMSSELILEAGAVLSDNGALTVDRRIVLSSIANAQAIKNMGDLYHSAAVITKMFETGLVTRDVYGFDAAMDSNVVAHKFGSAVGVDTITVDGANQTGSTLRISGLTNTLEKGDKFKIDGVYKQFKLTGESNGELQEFSVVSVNTAKDTLTISPAIKTEATDGNFANVTSAPATGAALTFVGTAGKLADFNVAFHKDAFILVFVDDNESRDGATTALATDPELGLSVRVTTQYDAMTSTKITRADAWFGWGFTRNELAVLIATSKQRVA